VLSETILIRQFELARNSTLQLAKDITEENADLMPKGFKNSLRWQLGHIYTSVEGLLFHFANESVTLPDGYGELFNTGTKPADWKGNPPQIEELVPLLVEQLNRVKETFTGRSSEKLSKPVELGPMKFETIGELLSFVSLHESEHQGRIKSLKDGIQAA